MWIWVWGSLNGLHSVIWLLSCNLMDYMRWIEGVSAQFLDTCMKQLPLPSHLCGGVCRIFHLVSVFLCQKQLLRIILNSDNNKRKRKKKRNSCFQWSLMGWKRGSSLGYFPSLEKVHRFCCISLSLVRRIYFQMHRSGQRQMQGCGWGCPLWALGAKDWPLLWMVGDSGEVDGDSRDSLSCPDTQLCKCGF